MQSNVKLEIKCAARFHAQEGHFIVSNEELKNQIQNQNRTLMILGLKTTSGISQNK